MTRLYFSLLILTLLSHLTFADRPVFTDEDADSYDRGQWGRTPEERFQTVNTPAYRLLRREWDEEQCHDPDSYFFIGIRGSRLSHKGPTIFDSDGHQVWYNGAFDRTYNFKPQMYKGQPYLTWWNGQDAMGHGFGRAYMVSCGWSRVCDMLTVEVVR